MKIVAQSLYREDLIGFLMADHKPTDKLEVHAAESPHVRWLADDLLQIKFRSSICERAWELKNSPSLQMKLTQAKVREDEVVQGTTILRLEAEDILRRYVTMPAIKLVGLLKVFEVVYFVKSAGEPIALPDQPLRCPYRPVRFRVRRPKFSQVYISPWEYKIVFVPVIEHQKKSY